MTRRKLFITLALAVVLALASALGVAHAQSSTGAVSVSKQCALVPSALAQQISASEPWYCPINQQIYTQWQSQLPLAVIGVLLAFSIAAVITMLGIALRSDRLRNFGVGEIYEATASAMIVLLFLYVSAVMFGLLPAVLVGAINPFPVAFNFITTTIGQMEHVYNVYFQQYMLYAFQASITPIFSGFRGSTQVASVLQSAWAVPLSIYYIDPLLSLSLLLSDGLVTLWGEYYLMVFLASTAIPVFLVPGVVLRAIFPARALGGMLMAIGIAFYLVMPTMFALSFYLTYPGIQQALQTSAAQAARFAVNPPPPASVASPTSPVVLQLQSVESAMSQFWLLTLFYPMLIAGVTYAFVTQVSKFIGGAAMMGGRMRGFI